MLLRNAVLVGALLLAGCSGHWLSFFGQQNPLVGRIWDVAGEEFITERELIGRLGQATYVMLGEKHDNFDHHRLQAQMLRQLYDFGRNPALAFEMIDFDQAAALQGHLAATPKDTAQAAQSIGKAVKWERTGWPDWQHYRPLAQAALAAGAPVVAANLPRRLSRAIGKQGYHALEADLVSRTGLDQPLHPYDRLAMEKEIGASHCGYTCPSRLCRPSPGCSAPRMPPWPMLWCASGPAPCSSPAPATPAPITACPWCWTAWHPMPWCCR